MMRDNFLLFQDDLYEDRPHIQNLDRLNLEFYKSPHSNVMRIRNPAPTGVLLDNRF